MPNSLCNQYIQKRFRAWLGMLSTDFFPTYFQWGFLLTASVLTVLCRHQFEQPSLLGCLEIYFILRLARHLDFFTGPFFLSFPRIVGGKMNKTRGTINQSIVSRKERGRTQKTRYGAVDWGGMGYTLRNQGNCASSLSNLFYTETGKALGILKCAFHSWAFIEV